MEAEDILEEARQAYVTHRFIESPSLRYTATYWPTIKQHRKPEQLFRPKSKVALDMISPHLALPTVVPHLHPGAVCSVYLANITQVIDLLEGLRCTALPLLCERIIEVPVRDWRVAPALRKDGRFCTRKAPLQDRGDQSEEDEESDEEEKEVTPEGHPPFGSVPYIARPDPEQMSHTAFLVKLRKCVT